MESFHCRFARNDDASILKKSSLALLCYLLFGFLHEGVHLLCASYFEGIEQLKKDGLFLQLWRALLGRQCSISGLTEDQAIFVRHAGWMFSCFLAVMVHAGLRFTSTRHQEGKNPSSFNQTAQIVILSAYATALEAVSTDLLLLMPANARSEVFFCGNFGLIILNHAWLHAPSERGNCNSALKVLKDMIRVTMMRGAQSGGVVTFEPESNGQVKAIRSRVVNRKRTDLSEKIIAKVKSDNRFRSPQKVKTFSGHTRFATTSIANFDGTHPHRWTPRATRRVMDFKTAQIKTLGVENYVMHNGDFDFYDLNGTTYDLETIQGWLEEVTRFPMPSTGDSAAIAGMVDLLRTQGSFALSARYALCLGLSSSNMHTNFALNLPKNFQLYEKIGMIFENALQQHFEALSSKMPPVEVLAETAKSPRMRQEMAKVAGPLLRAQYKELLASLVPFHLSAPTPDGDDDEEKGSEDSKSIARFARVTIDAFFDNDLLFVVKTFLANAHGSFGLCVTSTLDANSQMCLAARGQTMSVAFYPKKGVICYGSEQAAVKAALNMDTPGGDLLPIPMDKEIDDALNRYAARLDLDDLGGEICLIDWNTEKDEPPMSYPNRNLKTYTIMNDTVRIVLSQQRSTAEHHDRTLFHRMTLLEGNDCIKPLKDEPEDLVLSDIQSIPAVCKKIQQDWQNVGDKISFNRLTALTLSRCLIRRLDALASGKIQRQAGTIDILLTGCEVSLWLAEQMASDLKKAFTKLNIMAVSSNKLLGLFGQEQSIPAIGYPMSQKTTNLTDTIVIIVSHSGGTFGPLQCSNLLQSATRNIFAVTSEWDTQVGKQLRAMYADHETLVDNSRVFTTDVGLAPAEPCSLSVAAMQQLLTNIFEHICIVSISNPRYRHVTGAVITERDLEILERCNRDNITAMEQIVGVDADGTHLEGEFTRTVNELRAMGNHWSEHILENAKAYLMSFIYIVFTVTTGWPLISGIGHACGAESEWLIYLLRFLDSLLYFWLPQINITLLRLVQGRDLLHRMVGRTVVIGDCPWVAQSAEAFLSKLFACSYSIAGVNVLSANPADHLVHRHTHRVVRGTLFVSGRPDGRLMALTSLESSVLLSVNQASSIQSWGGRCESITIGHNPFDNPLCYRNIFLDRHRPLFLCERVLDMTSSPSPPIPPMSKISKLSLPAPVKKAIKAGMTDKPSNGSPTNDSSKDRPTARTLTKSGMSSTALLGKYSTLQNESKREMEMRKSKRNKLATNIGNRVLASFNEREDLLNLSRHKFVDSSQHNMNSSRHGVNSSRHGGLNSSRHNFIPRRRGSHRRVDSYDQEKNQNLNMEMEGIGIKPEHIPSHGMVVDDVLNEMRLEQAEITAVQRIFAEFDKDNSGYLDREEFVKAYEFIDPSFSRSEALKLFEEADVDDSGELDFGEFFRLTVNPTLKLQAMKQVNIRDHVGLVQVKPAEGRYFDDDLYRKNTPGVSKIALAKSETLAQELYESRVASLQRFVSMTVMFHQMAFRVQSFFSNISFGFWGYRIDRTHSIMRVATTASPASGAHVRKQMEALRLVTNLNRSVHTISAAWFRYKDRKVKRLLIQQESSLSRITDRTSNSSSNSLASLVNEASKPRPKQTFDV